MADGRRFNGGHSIKNAGRKKGIGLSYTIKSACEKMIFELMEDELFRKKALQETFEFIRCEKDQGFLYVIQLNQSFKIGYSRDWNKRKKSYNTHSNGWELVYLVEHKEAFEMECFLHNMFKNQRLDGEWFNLSNENLISIMKYCSRIING